MGGRLNIREVLWRGFKNEHQGVSLKNILEYTGAWGVWVSQDGFDGQNKNRHGS